MPNVSASVPYDPLQGVTPAEGVPGARLETHAGPEDFGAQVGQGLEKVGAAGEDIAHKYAMMATEAKANDAIANQWAPTASSLRSDYDQLRGADKIAGYDTYIGNLTSARDKLIDNASSPYEKQILGNYVTHHIANEIDGARRELDTSFNQFADQAHADKIATDSQYAVTNYNNPGVVASSMGMVNAQIQKHGMDRGLDQDSIDQQQRDAQGSVATGMVNRALSFNDVGTANAVYNSTKEVIPGFHRLEISKTLHSMNIQNYGQSSVGALTAGEPLPPAGGSPQVQEVRVAVADAAQNGGVDANHALAVARIESAEGQNVGTRGDIGQTGKPAKDLNEQASNMVTELKKSETVADNALGRKSEPWEQYVCYQQGEGGGPALLKAADTDPNARAVDVLRPLYKDPKDALAAVQNNGGNATMTATQFLDYIKQNYAANAKRAQCEVPQGGSAPVQSPVAEGGEVTAQQPAAPSLPDAIRNQNQGQGVAVQPGATPMQSYLNFNQAYPDMLQRAMQIPNLDERDGVLKVLEQKHSLYQAAASAWKVNFTQQAQTLAMSPKFTDVSMIPPDMRSALADDPMMMNYLETRAKYNLDNGSGMATKDQREYGPGFYDLFKAVHAPAGDPGRITSMDQLYQHVGKDGDLTISGLDKLTAELKGKNTPDGDAESAMKAQSFKAIKNMLSGEDEGLHIKDPKGEMIYAHAMPLLYQAIDAGKTKGLTASQLFDPESKDWIGNSVKGLKRSQAQQAADMMSGGAEAAGGERNLQAIIRDVQSGKLSNEDGKSEAKKLGLIRVSAPAVPVSQ